MIWQDLVFTVGGLLLALLLIPMIRDPDAAAPRTTSIPTAVVLYVFGVAFLTLGLYGSAAMNTMTALCWTFIAAKRTP